MIYYNVINAIQTSQILNPINYYQSSMQKKLTVFILALSLTTIAFFAYSSKTFINHLTSIDEFEQWKTLYGSPFSPSEEVYRKIIFFNNLLEINKHNNDNSQSYKMGVNQFSIYSKEQFKQIYLSNLQYQDVQKLTQSQQILEVADIDWTTKQGVVGPVRAQGQCHASWAFTTLGVMQSSYKLLYNKSVTLSPQQLIDCSKQYGTLGCNGGLPDSVVPYLQIKGVVAQSQYPFVQKEQTCQKDGGSFKIKSYERASYCTGLQNLLTVSPIVVTVDASNMGSYKSGVFNNCAQTVNHCVILVGILNNNWKIKNNWGTSWGQSGYMRIASGNTCGICSRQPLLLQV